MTFKRILLAGLGILLAALAFYLFRPVSNIPDPAEFTCLEIEEGTFIAADSLPEPGHIYGMGLTYRKHLLETASSYNPDVPPPIFIKKPQSLSRGSSQVKLPAAEALISAAAELEPELEEKLDESFPNLTAMLDYEVELGFVLLEPISSAELAAEDFMPKLGFFIANDLSARSLALLGEGTDQRYEFWGISKSFPGFMPMSDSIWLPHSPDARSIPCIRIETYVNGEMRQSQTTDNMIITPSEMLRFIHEKYPGQQLKQGDMVLMGTPGGVAIATPRALVRLSNLLGFDRYKKLGIKLGGDLSVFLQAGDQVEILGEGFGAVKTKVIR